MYPNPWRDLPSNLFLDECVSTNSELRRLGDLGAPHGTWIAARLQTGGRGRLGNVWLSAEGNLFYSVLLRFEGHSPLWTWIPLLAALCVREAVVSERPDFESRLKVKWPNDLWLDGAKVCGILCESAGSSSGSYIVVGIGLNCAQIPAGLPDGLKVSSVGVSREKARELIHERLLERLKNVQREALSQECMQYAEFPRGTSVQWKPRDGNGPQEFGVVDSLGSYGELIVRLPDGRLHSLFAEDVSLRAVP
jgi:BirA family biotin operon repressor/biotin-[acetyl-CoA-carboxylase] ligase